MQSASKTIQQAVLSWSNVEAKPHRFGGTEYVIGKREIGHIHGDWLVDIPFPVKVREEVVASGKAERHHILPDSGWISKYLREQKDVDEAIELFKLSYDIAAKQKGLSESSNDS